MKLDVKGAQLAGEGEGREIIFASTIYETNLLKYI